jgi:hypothetical protein
MRLFRTLVVLATVAVGTVWTAGDDGPGDPGVNLAQLFLSQLRDS